MKCQAIIPSAGAGLRLKKQSAKALVALNGQPLIAHVLKTFQECSLIDSIIVVAPKNSLRDFREITKPFHKVKRIVPGGVTRRESVAFGLEALDDDTDIVLIHDAARPLITRELVKKAILAVKKYSACVVGVPVKSTVKIIDSRNGFVKATPERATLWEAQTPQVFQKSIILKAHQRVKSRNPSDDALLVEQLGIKVKMVMGNYKNIKITTPEDLTLAETFLKGRRS